MVQLVVFFSSGSQNNYMEGPGSPKIKKNAAHPKHQEEEETSRSRKHIITSKP